jgi:hypothetical protein
VFRLRTIVAAVGVMLVLGGSLAPAFAAPAREAVGSAAGIDATGATDVTADLQALFDRTPDGGVVSLEAGADYRVDGTLVVQERHNLTIEGNGARIFATTTGDRVRSHLRIVGGSGFDIRSLEIEGANPHAGLSDRAYVPELEGQHGIRLEGVTDVELDRVRIHDTYGDHVLVGRHEGDRRWSEQVWIHDSTFARSGRQGIAVVAGRDIVIERNSFTDMRRATVDLEPTARSWGAENVHILDNEVGPGRLLFIAAAGSGPVNRVIVARNTLRGRILSVWVLAEEGARRRHVWVVDNTTDTPAANPLRFRRVDGVIVHGNRQPLLATRALVEATDSCDVAITDNDIAPGTRTLEGGTRECNFILPVKPPAPPPVAGRGQEQAPPPSPTTTTPPTTVAPSTTTPPTSPTTETPPSTPTSGPPSEVSGTDESLTAASRSADQGVAVPVVVVTTVLAALAGAGGAWAINARRRPR